MPPHPVSVVLADVYQRNCSKRGCIRRMSESTLLSDRVIIHFANGKALTHFVNTTSPNLYCPGQKMRDSGHSLPERPLRKQCGLVSPELSKAFHRKLEQVLEHPVHDRDELPELVGIMVGLARLLRGPPALHVRDAQLHAQRVLLRLRAQPVAVIVERRAGDQDLVRGYGPVDRDGESRSCTGTSGGPATYGRSSPRSCSRPRRRQQPRTPPSSRPAARSVPCPWPG